MEEEEEEGGVGSPACAGETLIRLHIMHFFVFLWRWMEGEDESVVVEEVGLVVVVRGGG